uniref:Transposon protein, putative, mutator sub-class n=1 Tax=Oryza sativa subsp. japonica TaxID=39947 RepID=Q84MW7_ORYSJ|nr:transposon protein, putative, mutator sub-class [Oryza sativa Japonica Group]
MEGGVAGGGAGFGAGAGRRRRRRRRSKAAAEQAVDVRVQPYATVDADGRKIISKGGTGHWVIDSESFSFDFLMESLRVEFKWGSNQSPLVWYFNKNLGEDVRLIGDTDLPDIFEMYATEASFHLLVAVLEESMDVASVCCVHEPIAIIPPENPSHNDGSGQAATNVGGSAQPTTVEADVREPDMFDNEEEYVGPAAIGVGGQSSQTAATGVEAPEVEVTDEDPQVVRVLHDPENPNIVKNALFPDMISFRKAVRHYAIKKGFEFADLKTAKTRFIATCRAEGCPWRIRASLIHDKKTIKITVLPFEHKCASTKLREGKMATQGWVADRLGDWLKNNPKKGAKDARGKLQEQYEIKLKYSKAWSGCRPYVGVDSTKLTGKYTGQLASATSVDGHNWLFYVSYAIFDLATDDNWLWFMKQLNRAIGCPEGLVISTDACKGLEKAVSAAFSDPVEHRECIRHLYVNFLKKYHGSVITEHLYPAARSYTEEGFKCGFGESSKCDYLTNNVSESFNAQIRNLKGLLPHELVDSIRELIMEKMATRRDVGKKMDDGIIPGVMKQLNDATSLLKVVKIARSDDGFAEVTLVDTDNKTRRHIVDLDNQKCSCRAWQITGKPCRHALAWICSSGGRIQDFVSPYYSVQMFRIAYAGRVPPMTDRTQWPVVDLGFKVHVPKQKRGAGRPRVQRIRGFLEPGRKRVKCKRCKRFGHFEKTCKLAEPADADDMSSHCTPQKRYIAVIVLLFLISLCASGLYSLTPT